jgi:hypothetical protein
MANGPGRRAIWAGRVVSAIPVAMMTLSGVMKLAGAFTQDPQRAQNWAHFGYPPSALLPIGVVELCCAALYAVPRTAALGAVLVTGYLGGAIATHVRVSEPVWIAPLLLGVLAWLGLYLRDVRLRALLPVRSEPGK